jgi:hypothetical protein
MLFKWNDATVQAAIIVASVTLLTVLAGLIFKDFLIPGIVEKRSKNRRGHALFNQYRINLFRACEAFLARIAEIYRVRSHYLWQGAPKSEFYNYKYKSSIYRIGVLLGWIRGYRLQEAIIFFKDKDTRHRLSEAIGNVSKALADGQMVEMYVSRSVCRVLGVNTERLPAITLRKFSVQIDALIEKYTTDRDVNSVSELPTESKDAFVKELVQLATFRPDQKI